MEFGVYPNNMQDGTITHNSNQVEEAEWDGNPVVKFLIARDTYEIECGGQGVARIWRCHIADCYKAIQFHNHIPVRMLQDRFCIR